MGLQNFSLESRDFFLSSYDFWFKNNKVCLEKPIKIQTAFQNIKLHVTLQLKSHDIFWVYFFIPTISFSYTIAKIE